MKIEEITKLMEFVHKYSISELRIKINEDKIIIKSSDVKSKNEIDRIDEKEKETYVVEKVIKAPLVGIFYSAPSTSSENYVKIGDKIVKGQTLAIIEAMKLMNEIKADQEGIIEKILVENGQMVEYGQPLFVVK